GSAGFRETGMLLPRAGRMVKDMLLDQGTIYLFDTTGKKEPRTLRGHQGPVLSMIFAPAHDDKPALLVSAARESHGGETGGYLRPLGGGEGEEAGGRAQGGGPGEGGEDRPGARAGRPRAEGRGG